jgi:hypothetical protein
MFYLIISVLIKASQQGYFVAYLFGNVNGGIMNTLRGDSPWTITVKAHRESSP